MTAKSILDIDINDASFKEFFEQFRQYEELLSTLPSKWDDVNASLRTAADSFAASAASVGALAKSMEGASYSTSRFEHSAERSSRVMGKVAENARVAASYIGKIATWTGVSTALFGGLSLFGVDRLARSAYGSYRSAAGLGITTGEQAAFGLNYGPYVDPTSTLTNVARARNDLSMLPAFSALGITSAQLATMDNADLARVVTRRARDMWRHGPHNIQYAQAMGLTHFFSLEELRRLGNTPDRVFNASAAQYGADRNRLTLPPSVLREWTAFDVQLHRAGVQIETTFIGGLAHLTQPLAHLSDAMSRVIASLMHSDAVSHGINWLASELDSPGFRHGVDHFVSFLGSPRFARDLDELGAGLESVLEHIARGLRLLGLLPSSPSAPVPSAPLLGAPAGLYTPSETQALQREYQRMRSAAAGTAIPSAYDLMEARATAGATPASTWRALINASSSRYHLPAGLQWRLFGAESSYGRDMLSPAGALGGFQFMPDTARGLGINPWDPTQASAGSARYLRLLYLRFGDWRKAVAAYNLGPGRLEREIAQYHDAWEQHLPRETQGELRRVFPTTPAFDWAQPHAAERWNAWLAQHGGTPAQQTARTLRQHMRAGVVPGAESPSAGVPADQVVAQEIRRLRHELSRRPGGSPLAVRVYNETSAHVAIAARQVAN